MILKLHKRPSSISQESRLATAIGKLWLIHSRFHSGLVSVTHLEVGMTGFVQSKLKSISWEIYAVAFIWIDTVYNYHRLFFVYTMAIFTRCHNVLRANCAIVSGCDRCQDAWWEQRKWKQYTAWYTRMQIEDWLFKDLITSFYEKVLKLDVYVNWTIVITSFLNRGGCLVTCVTQLPTETRDDQYGGPTPRGEFLIGKRYTHRSYSIDWYNLYPKKEDSSGYYRYTQRTQTGRYAMGLHPGTVSEGCVTVKAPLYNEDPCWKKIRDVIDSGTMQYRGSGYSGFLYVK